MYELSIAQSTCEYEHFKTDQCYGKDCYKGMTRRSQNPKLLG